MWGFPVYISAPPSRLDAVEVRESRDPDFSGPDVNFRQEWIFVILDRPADSADLQEEQVGKVLVGSVALEDEHLDPMSDEGYLLLQIVAKLILGNHHPALHANERQPLHVGCGGLEVGVEL